MNVIGLGYPTAIPRVARGYIEQLPSGSFRVDVYAGTDPLTRRAIRLRSTVKTEQQAQIELGRLLKEASEGRTPESDATVAKLMDEYAAIASWDVTTRQTNEGFIRRTIKPALGHLEVRKVRGPILDQLYARLKRCGDLSCSGRPFTEHRNIPALTMDPRDRRPVWQQVAETLAKTVRSGSLAPGDEFPSITELSVSQGIGTGVIRRALEVLAADGLILARSGQRPVVAGTAAAAPVGGRRRPGPGHDCRRAGCRPHVCHPMKASTIRGIHSILSGAFAAAQRWEWHVRKDTKTHQDRWLAIGPDTCALIAGYLDEIRTELADVGVQLREDAYLFSNDPAHSRPWNPDWATHKVTEAAAAAGVDLDIKGGRHYTASQLLAGGFDLRNTAAYLAKLTAGSGRPK